MYKFFDNMELSEAYLNHRPLPPSEVYTLINQKLQESTDQLPDQLKKKWQKEDGRWSYAVDVGCGPGMSTLPLLDFCKAVFAIDGSESQIFAAIQNYGNRDPNKVTFRLAEACEISSLVESESVDLVTLFVSAHWIEREKFYNEVKKVLRPGGLMVLYTYGFESFQEPEAEKINQEYIEQMEEFTDKRVYHVKEKYQKIYQELKNNFKHVERVDKIKLNKDYSINSYLGFHKSLSMYNEYLKRKNIKSMSEEDLLFKHIQKIKKVYGDKSFKSISDVVVLFARKD